MDDEIVLCIYKLFFGSHVEREKADMTLRRRDVPGSAIIECKRQAIYARAELRSAVLKLKHKQLTRRQQLSNDGFQPFSTGTRGRPSPFNQRRKKQPTGFWNSAEDMAEDWWNAPSTRRNIPDFITIGIGFDGIFGIGAGTIFELNWVVRGPEASLGPALTATQTIGAGYSIDAVLTVGGSTYAGSVENIDRSMLQTSISNGKVTMWGEAGFAAGLEASLNGSYTPTRSGYGIIEQSIEMGFGLPAGPVPVNAAGGVSNSWVLFDAYEE